MSAAQSRATFLAVAACLAVLCATVLPWIRSGATRRSAFALARGADALGFIDSPGRRALLVVWYLLPFLTAATWTAAALRRAGVVALLAALVGGMSTAAGIVVMVWVRAEPGPVLAVVAGAAAVVCATLVVLAGRDARGDIAIEGGRT